jgi:long-chain acyl-CoA synthetase
LPICGSENLDNDGTLESSTMVGKETIIECLQEHVEKRGGALYMTQPMGGGAGEIKTWTFQEAWEEATRMAAFLKAKDLPPGSSIALCSKNRSH